MNLVDPILFQSRFQPMAPAIILAGDHPPITYAQLGRFIHSVSRKAHKHGLIPGQVVALLVNDPILHIAFVLGLTKLGAVTVSGHQLELPPVLRADAVLSDTPLPSAAAPVTKIGWDWLRDDYTPIKSDPRKVAENKYSRLILTSGTTGEPKAVALTHAQALTRVMRQPFVFGSRFSECSRVLIDMGLSTVAGFSAMFSTFWRGGALFLRSKDVDETLRSLSANRIQAMVASPKGLAELVELHDKMPDRFGKFEVIVSSGSALDRRLLKRARAHLCNDLCSIYGSTEYATVAVAPSELLGEINGVAGYVIGGAEVEIVDSDGKILPVGAEGRVRTRGVSAAEGYVDGTLDRVEAFPKEGFCLGDLGVIMPQGYLMISGRENAVINLGGDKISPERVELAIVDYPGIRDAGVFTLQTPLGLDRLIAAVVWDGSGHRETRMRDLHAFVAGKLPLQYIPKLFVTLGGIPRNHMGKIDRPALKQLATEALRKTPVSADAGGS